MKYARLFLFMTLNTLSSSALADTVKVKITGIEEAKGSIRVALFPESKKQQFPQPEDVKQIAIKAQMDGVFVVFKDVKSGTYAISVLHDENNNKEMDTFLGIPQEAYGNSGEYTRLEPDFEDSKFMVTDKNINMEIKVH